jgi:hypothetical protein
MLERLLAGVWRSLVARFVRDEEAVGSNPATPTNRNNPPAVWVGFCVWLHLRCWGYRTSEGRATVPATYGDIRPKGIKSS